MTPRLGQRVRFTGEHRFVERGVTGTIDQISGEQFVVLCDSGGWFPWTSFASWEPTGEPDVELPDQYIALRNQ